MPIWISTMSHHVHDNAVIGTATAEGRGKPCDGHTFVEPRNIVRMHEGFHVTCLRGSSA